MNMAERRNPPNRQRPIQVKFFVEEKEIDLIKQKMSQFGIRNMSVYLRKMAIDRYALVTVIIESFTDSSFYTGLLGGYY